MFVYGTLRRDARAQTLSPLCEGWLFKGYGSVRGELYDFGAYPGAAQTESPHSRIRGEVYELPDAVAMLPPIDRYEGCSDEDPEPHEFVRELVDVDLEAGGVCRAWIYWYSLRPLGRRLESGDYLERTGDRPASR
jgi:gamma-glutamylcyclotransferase (GGCT)/AIG2-like uncharacterized protein YtfP